MATPPTPNFAQLLGPFITAIPEPSRPGLLCGLERTAADRYREWAEQCPTSQREPLLACAAREDEIADRVSRILPPDPADRPRLDAELAGARKLYREVFDGLTMHEQWRIQADAERQGAAAWRGIAAEQPDATRRDELETCARLEEASAVQLEKLLAGD